MSRARRHKILVEVTTYRGETTKEVCGMVERKLWKPNSVYNDGLVNARAKNISKVIKGLLMRLSCYEALNVLEGKSKEGWRR